MKYIITENQYTNYRKSIVLRVLRRVGHRIDEIVDASVKDIFNWFSKGEGHLKEMGPDEFSSRVISDVFEYVYESYIMPDVEFGGEERDIMMDYLFMRYEQHIKEMYHSLMGQNNITESDDKGRNKQQFFQDLINDILNYIKVGCDKSYDEFPQDISFDMCDEAELIRNIEIMDIYRSKTEYVLDVRVKYFSINRHVDMGEVLYDIGEMMRKKTGIRFWVREKENVNTNKNRQW